MKTLYLVCDSGKQYTIIADKIVHICMDLKIGYSQACPILSRTIEIWFTNQIPPIKLYYLNDELGYNRAIETYNKLIEILK
jgi:hypothetical protein